MNELVDIWEATKIDQCMKLYIIEEKHLEEIQCK
jgi:hypothetical protein